MTPSALLARAEALLATGWCQNVSARAGRTEVEPDDPARTALCLVEAVEQSAEAAPKRGRERLKIATYRALWRAQSGEEPEADDDAITGLIGWQDAAGRTKTQVIALLKRTREALESGEAPRPAGRSGPSGPARSHAQRQANGLVRLVAWVPTETAVQLAEIRVSRGLDAKGGIVWAIETAHKTIKK